MLETPLELTLCTCCCQSVSRHDQADRFSGSIFLYCTAKEPPKEFQTIVHSWESLVTGSDVGVCVNILLFSRQSSRHATHSALPWISQAAQIAGQCRAVFSNSDRSQKPSAAGPEFVSWILLQGSVRAQLLQPRGSESSECCPWTGQDGSWAPWHCWNGTGCFSQAAAARPEHTTGFAGKN